MSKRKREASVGQTEAVQDTNTMKLWRKGKSKDQLVNDGNQLSTTDFKARYIEDKMLDSHDFTWDYKAASELTSEEFKACFKLIELTSRQDYEASSIGWHPKRKKREMKEDTMRYLLVRPKIKNESTQNQRKDPPLGFMSFMSTHDSIPSVPVFYLYEIHLSETLRGCGIGTYLMETIEGIGDRVAVEKVMLTCFMSNANARRFYEKRGYVTDVSSPEDRVMRDKTIQSDYVIMSKTLPGECW